MSDYAADVAVPLNCAGSAQAEGTMGALAPLGLLSLDRDGALPG